jgi:hypothetical protein
VRDLLGLPRAPVLGRLLRFYPAVARLGLRPAVRRALVPPAQMAAVRRLDRPAEAPGATP